MIMPKVTVVIITYNQENYIAESIESVLMQKVNFEYELIVSDDASTDNTPNIIKEYAKKYSVIKPILYKNNVGASKNYMNAVAQAIGDNIVVFEGDDYWCSEDKLQTQYNFLNENKHYFAVSHILEKKDDLGNSYGINPNDDRIVGKDATMSLFLKGITFSCMATMYRNVFKEKEIFDKYYDYITKHRLVADFPLCMFFLTNGRIKVLNNVFSVYRVSGETVNTTSYNSQTKTLKKLEDHMFVINESEKFFNYKYDFSILELNNIFYLALEVILKKQFNILLEIIKKIPFKLKLKFVPFFCIKLIKEIFNKVFKKG